MDEVINPMEEAVENAIDELKLWKQTHRAIFFEKALEYIKICQDINESTNSENQNDSSELLLRLINIGLKKPCIKIYQDNKSIVFNFERVKATVDAHGNISVQATKGTPYHYSSSKLEDAVIMKMKL